MNAKIKEALQMLKDDPEMPKKKAVYIALIEAALGGEDE